jgi:GTP-binding protein
MLKVVLCGRPNTGKSTLFNALTRTRDALVHDRPGVTRDVVESKCVLADDRTICLFDTAGLEKARDGIAADSTKIALHAIEKADAVLFVVDGRDGILAADMDWAKAIKKAARAHPGLKVLLVMNKAESKRGMENISDFYKLGFGTPIAVSGAHKIGFGDIYDWLGERDKEKGADKQVQAPDADSPRGLSIAIIGQPNVGKSTLINQIFGAQRVIVRDEPGVTRDTIKIETRYLGRDITLMDTAGLRRKAGITDDLETLSALKALDALTKTDAVVLVVDATRDIENQALGIAGRVYDAGKILTVALNKWDLIDETEREGKLLKLKHQFSNSFSQIIKPVILPISAEKGTGVKNLIKRVYDLWDRSNTHAATSFINRTVERLVEAHQPPMSKLKRRMKIKFARQTREHPITILINVGGASDIPDSYTRYLRRGIATALNWESLPVVIEYAKDGNPYENK